MDKLPEISVVVPMYNEEKNAEMLYREITGSLKQMRKSYEIIFVDDGSEDGTGSIIDSLASGDSRLRPIHLARNFGQTAAFSAGFDSSRGAIIVTLDGDLQNDPGDLPKLVAKIEQGYDVASGWRYSRKDPIGKRLPSRLSNWLARKLTGLEIHDSGCSLKAYRAEILKGIQLYGEMHRFIPALCHFKGAKVAEVKVSHRPRKFGRTKYGTRRLMNGLLDLMYVTFWGSYSTKPLHFLGKLGIFQYFLAMLVFAEQAAKAVFVRSLTLGPLLMLGILLLITGTLFIIFGFLLEILIRTYYMKSGERPYMVRK